MGTLAFLTSYAAAPRESTVLGVGPALVGPMPGTTDALLASEDASPLRADPGRDGRVRQRAFEEFWDGIELQRALVADPGRWRTRFASGIHNI